ncbi:hypothetical protein [Agromyces aerolatus]|uniref:hypothetical protein n=1 Tax=Agromyces sp. LY-1074 TaxID=3074080 RepID=UPI00285DE021|nr:MULTISPECIES: hypothetical protein [unclassified Agromyces]MDR5699024.1 hypothetical protein [Agromyces sp. LY-1074]MDR5705198.1 hypothetical protein [Agromyces sp. LY-1358]
MSTDQNNDAPAGPFERGSDSFEPFAVSQILLNDLPSVLGTIDAPERYTVTAVFTRRPLPLELELLASPATQALLSDAGYPSVGLTTADRRLFITNTNLSELRQGLALVIGRILDGIGARAAETRRSQAREAAELAKRAAERVERVVAEASQIDFSPHNPHYN